MNDKAHNKLIDESLKEIESILKPNIELAEKVSDDVAILEDRLNSLGYKEEFVYFIANPDLININDPIIYLCWRKNKSQKERWRISYVFSDNREYFEKPLSETKVNIRVFCSDYLPEFVVQLVDQIKGKQ